MTQVEWDAMRSGVGVLLHVDGAAELVHGVVAIVTPVEGSEANEIAVRIEDDDESYYVWPTLADVHAEPHDATEACAQCGLVRL